MKPTLKAGLGKDQDVFVPSSQLTVKQIQDSIPPHYFLLSNRKSLMYLMRDVTQTAVAFGLMSTCISPALLAFQAALSESALPSTVSLILGLSIKFAIWNIFWLVQGLNLTAFWVLAHECGHHAFSTNRQVNNTVGMILHSSVLVPYHSWRITHGNHHKHTNHLAKDNAFVPRKENKILDLVEESPLVMFGEMLAMFLVGWPAYLLFNTTGQDYGRRANHFEPYCPLFRPEDAQDVIISDLGILGMLTLLGICGYKFGSYSVLCYYGIPYLWVNFWLLLITYLQHTDIRVPHYSHEEWTFVRGAVAAVDRDYSWLINRWLHHINDSHVVHHLFGRMPFYNAIIVTRKHIRDILGDTYVEDKRPIYEALVGTWTSCRYVIPSDGVSLFYGFNKKRPVK